MEFEPAAVERGVGFALVVGYLVKVELVAF